LVASLSATASGAEDQPQLAAFSRTGDCSGFILETLTGVETGCRTVPLANQGGVWSAAADGSMVGNGENGPGSAAPVTLVRPDGQVAVLDSNPDDYNPSLSPDGSQVVFARLVPQPYQGAWPSNLYVVNTDGSNLKEVAKGGVNQFDVPTFSPDGSTIAYACEPSFAWGIGGVSTGCGPLPDGSTREFGTLLMNADGSDKRMIVIGQAQTISWSADGHLIATTSVVPCSCPGNPDVGELFVYHTDGSDLFNDGDPGQEVTTDASGGYDPQFTPGSSTQLAFFRASDDSGGDDGYTYMVNTDGTNYHELSLSDDGAQYGDIIPTASGGGPPPMVNVMRVRVPRVRSFSYQAAKLRLQAAHLRVGSVHRRYSHAPENHVIGQRPRGGTYAHRKTKQGPPVKLTLSRGPRK
jgi:hypothetical protein